MEKKWYQLQSYPISQIPFLKIGAIYHKRDTFFHEVGMDFIPRNVYEGPYEQSFKWGIAKKAE